MKILSVRMRRATPSFSAGSSPPPGTADEQTMVVTAAPSGPFRTGYPAAVSVVNGDEMRQAAPRVNLSESLGAVPGLQVQNRQTMPRICSCRFAALAPAPPTACAGCAFMWTAFRRPCPTARANVEY